ncbi:DUF885 domain-containing protein [Candidatus Bathyarchaeota archaeon]|nr:MAG: DUF885 domain-containing protein [Candidatus Bathyarchaeota archaeon]
MLVSRLDKLEQEVFNHVFKLNPRQAVMLGLHDYDGLLPDVSPGGLKAWMDKAAGLLDRVKRESHGLDKDGHLDALCLETMLERVLFDAQDLRGYATRPNIYSMQLSLTPYTSREYAPVDARIEAVNKHLGRVPGFLDQASRNLDETLAQPIVEVATKQVQGVLRDLDGNATQEAGKASAPVREEFENLKRDVVVAMASFVEALSEEHSLSMDFALGRERFQKLLWVNDRISRPVEEVLAMGLSDLESNLKALRELAEKIGPGKTIASVIEGIQEIHPTAHRLIDETGEGLRDLELWFREHDLVSIPAGTKVRVVPTPMHMRATTTAAMSSPGPFEKEGLEGLYYVTPPEDSWDLKTREEWLRHLNYVTLKDISIHEVFPGHYIHRLFQREFGNSMTRKAYWNYAFGEGWAYGNDALRLIQLKEALLRDCRFIVSFWMHTQGLGVDQARQFIMENAYMETLPAEREALRGTFDHSYYGYTLGKLFIKKARERFFHAHSTASAKEFHDKLLGLGGAPVGLLEELIV